MNRIYLFILALLAASGITASADANFTLNIQSGTASEKGGWTQIDLNKDNDNHFYVTVPVYHDGSVGLSIRNNFDNNKYWGKAEGASSWGDVKGSQVHQDGTKGLYYQIGYGDGNKGDIYIDGFEAGNYYYFDMYFNLYNDGRNFIKFLKTGETFDVNEGTGGNTGGVNDSDVLKKDLYIVGAFCEWDLNKAVKMNHTSGTNTWTLTSDNYIFATSWKICDGTWDFNFGYDNDGFEPNKENNAFFDKGNFPALDGNATVTFTYVNGSGFSGSSTPSKVKYTGAKLMGDNYYFYGDMNRWSSYLNAGKPVKVYSYEDTDKETDLAEDVFNGNIPNWYKVDVLNKDWRFKEVDAAHVFGPATVGSRWYYLDFANLYDSEGHKGRLCGQFKITMGDHDNENNWGNDEKGTVDYFKNVITANSTTPFEAKKGKEKTNLQLEANYVENAVLYFNPDTDQLMVKGNPVYNYVYYALTSGTPTEDMIENCSMDVVSQLNYHVNTNGFNGTDKDFDLGGNEDNGSYHWESTTATHPGTKKTYNVLRRRIPSGATHRFPTQITVKFSDIYEGDITNYPETRVLCDDIWFVRGSDINVYFRYDDDDATEALDWVCYNVFNNTFTKDGIVDGYNYLFGGTKKRSGDTQPQISNGEYAVMQYIDSHQKPGDDQAHHWWKSPMPVPAAFTSNSWVIFGESRGGIYPVNRVNSDDDDLGSVELNGEDLYYVVTTRENPALLYSTLNGSYSINQSENGIVQINAEFFDPATMNNPYPTLISDMGQVKYRFEIWYNGKLVKVSGPENEEDFEFENGFSVKPYYNWKMDSQPINPSEAGFNQFKNNPGYYFIVVKAMYDGNVYTAQDTYAIYE